MIFQDYFAAGRKFTRPLVITSGYFDPATSGHVALFKAVRDMFGDMPHLTVVNGNDACIKKKGYYFIEVQSRAIILDSIVYIDGVVIHDESNVAKVIEHLRPSYFVNSGDREISNANQEEMDACNQVRCVPIWLGLPKISSSSELVRNAVDFFNRSMLTNGA